MKFVCTRENIVQGLGRVTPVAGRNTQLPILQNVALRLRDGVLQATCTDLEVGVQATIPGKVEVEGSCTVPARKLFEYVQQLPASNPLTIELKKGTVHVGTTGFKAQFPVADDEDFPLLPALSGGHALNLKGEVLCRGLSSVMFAAARDATRPEIHSVFVVGRDTTVRMAATDSFRLAEDVVTLDESIDEFSFLLPLYTVQEIVRLFHAHDEVRITAHDTHLTIQGDGVELSSRLVDGKYPDYQQIIPQSFVTQGVVDREAFMRALKTLMVFLPRDSRRVQVAIKPEQGVMSLAVVGGEAGAGTVEVEFEGTGDDLEILFNIQYLLEGVQYIAGPRCHVSFVGNTEPALLRAESAEAAYRYVVMPIQL